MSRFKNLLQRYNFFFTYANKKGKKAGRSRIICTYASFFVILQRFSNFAEAQTIICNKMTLEEYISGHTTPENAVLEAITHDTYLHVLNAHMVSGQVQGRVLSMLSHMIRPKRILELGTFTGYSALRFMEAGFESLETNRLSNNVP